jgi:FkbM family methyltransferase
MNKVAYKLVPILLTLLFVVALAFFATRFFGETSVVRGLVLGMARHVDPYPCVIAPGRRFTVDFHGFTYFGDSSTIIDQTILCYGDWGLPELQFLSDAARLANRPDAVFLDIGANSGVYSLYMSKHVETVYAFDPYRPVLARFEKSIQASGISNIVIFPVGLGDSDQELPFEEPPSENTGSGSFVPGLMKGNVGKGLTLKIVHGDEYFGEQGIDRFEVFKIDTEGFERPVLAGLRESFSRNRPVGAFELTYQTGFDRLFGSEDEILKYLPVDYSLWIVEKEGESYVLEPFDFDFTDPEFHQATVAAIPHEKLDEFAKNLRR